MTAQYNVEMKNIRKSFGGVNALKDVTFRIKPGEVHALVGENGAGKSTLIKILSGAYLRDSGEIVIKGNKANPKTTSDMKNLGIGVIYQEFALASDLTVAENIFLHKLIHLNHGFVNWKKLYDDTAKLIEKIGFHVNPKEIVSNLSVAYQQIVEITKALSEDIDILVLDEPTAVLSPYETQMLFDVLLNLKAKGVSIIYISHRLDEVFKLADTITVLRDGNAINTYKKEETTIDAIVTEMIGRSADTLYPVRSNLKKGEEILRVDHLVNGNRVLDVSFSLYKGEILGIAGLVGSGKTETVRSIFGADSGYKGSIFVNGHKASIKNPYDSLKYGIGYLPENRKEHGVILSMMIKENITIAAISKVLSALGIITKKKERQEVEKLINELHIKTTGCDDIVNNLSGGNQQKVSLSKWLFSGSKILFLDEPTRGVDIGAKIEIYSIINELTKQGTSVIIVSSEIEEVVGMCDRVIVMGKGKVRGILEKDDINKDKIVLVSAGAK